MNILVIGASGFLGRFLCPHLRSQGHRVLEASSKNCDLQDPAALHLFDAERFEVIYHLAVWTQAGDFGLRHAGEQWVINQKINTHVLDWWQERQSQAKLVGLGTSFAYDPAYPLEEKYYLLGAPPESAYAYGMTKKMLLAGMESMHKQYNMNYLYLIISTLYGPNYHTDGRQKHFIFDLVHKILRGHLHGDPVVLWGNGEQMRELVHAQDFVETMGQLIDAGVQNTAINLGEGRQTSIRDFARIICEKVGYPFEKIQFDTARYVGSSSKILNIDRLRAKLPAYNPRTAHVGIPEVVDWFLSHRQLI